MTLRRVVYVFTSLLLLAGIWYMVEGEKKPVGIEKEVILNDFLDIRDNDIPEGELGGSFYVTNVCFPSDFEGKENDLFYVILEDGHVGLTQKYTIGNVGKEGKTRLTYTVTDNFKEFTLPPGKFINYEYRDGQYKLSGK